MRNGLTHENKGLPYKEIPKSTIKSLDEVYVCFDFLCNLQCPHCTLKDIPTKRELDKVLQTMLYIRRLNPNITFNFFGGEPLLLKDEELKPFKRFFKKPAIVSTNLLNLSSYKIKLLQRIADVNTSWNPHRFDQASYDKWLNNIRILISKHIPYSIMVTLTQDLIEEYNPAIFTSIIRSLQPRNLDLKFMVGDYNMDFNQIDDWLVSLYEYWFNDTIYLSVTNLLFKEMEQVIQGIRVWKNYCDKVATLQPNGNIKLGCPYFEYKTDKTACLYCKYYPICKGGCNIQEKCAFPKKLYERMLKDYDSEARIFRHQWN